MNSRKNRCEPSMVPANGGTPCRQGSVHSCPASWGQPHRATPVGRCYTDPCSLCTCMSPRRQPHSFSSVCCSSIHRNRTPSAVRMTPKSRPSSASTKRACRWTRTLQPPTFCTHPTRAFRESGMHRRRFLMAALCIQCYMHARATPNPQTYYLFAESGQEDPSV
jgi:hypothetical protein